MSYIFSGCNSLVSFPNISNWNISKATIKNDFNNNCFNVLKNPSEFI